MQEKLKGEKQSIELLLPVLRNFIAEFNKKLDFYIKEYKKSNKLVFVTAKPVNTIAREATVFDEENYQIAVATVNDFYNIKLYWQNSFADGFYSFLIEYNSKKTISGTIKNTNSNSKVCIVEQTNI